MDLRLEFRLPVLRQRRRWLTERPAVVPSQAAADLCKAKVQGFRTIGAAARSIPGNRPDHRRPCATPALTDTLQPHLTSAGQHAKTATRRFTCFLQPRRRGYPCQTNRQLPTRRHIDQQRIAVDNGDNMAAEKLATDGRKRRQQDKEGQQKFVHER